MVISKMLTTRITSLCREVSRFMKQLKRWHPTKHQLFFKLFGLAASEPYDSCRFSPKTDSVSHSILLIHRKSIQMSRLQENQFKISKFKFDLFDYYKLELHRSCSQYAVIRMQPIGMQKMAIARMSMKANCIRNACSVPVRETQCKRY